MQEHGVYNVLGKWARPSRRSTARSPPGERSLVGVVWHARTSLRILAGRDVMLHSGGQVGLMRLRSKGTKRTCWRKTIALRLRYITGVLVRSRLESAKARSQGINHFDGLQEFGETKYDCCNIKICTLTWKLSGRTAEWKGRRRAKD